MGLGLRKMEIYGILLAGIAPNRLTTTLKRDLMRQKELFRLLERQLQDYESQLSILNKRWPSYPEGSLRTRVRNDTPSFTRRMTFEGQLLEIRIHPHTRDNQRLIADLTEKRVAVHCRPLLKQNIRALRSALSKLQVYDPNQYIQPRIPSTDESDDSDDFPLVLPDRVFLPGQLNTGKWIRDTLTGNYRTNPYFPKDLKHESNAGRWLRSKSEADWDDELTEAGALFRYDSEIRLKSGKVIYADFVVLLPAENRLVIIEHFGRMDDPRYAMKNMRRLQEYAESGYILGRDLFFTMETKASPLTRSQIRATMRQAGLLPAGRDRSGP